ncbi:MAG: hypothetical protein KJ832_24035 [Gammaproteobacteria bacterium]|nr:hypothetical protein [Gammaproteobacteria bacterium]
MSTRNSDSDSPYVTELPAPRPKVKRRSGAGIVAVGIIAALVLTFTGAIGYRVLTRPPLIDASVAHQAHPLLPPGMPLTPTSKPVVGNLGGLPVTFPPGFAMSVEYEGDPEIGYKRNGPIPPRTHQSGIRSMGFKVKHPEFAVTTFRGRADDQQKYKRRETPWIDFTVTASSYFGDGLFLERSFAAMNEDKGFQYNKNPDLQYGLEVYSPYTVDKSLRNYRHGYGYLHDLRDRDIFVYRNKEGMVETLIKCSNVNHDAAPCSQYFYVNPNFKIELTANYRRGMLPYWQEIQTKSKTLVFQFEAKN